MRFSIDNIRNISNLIRELSVGLTKLAFNDNFEGFEIEVFISANSVLEIRNTLQFIPSKRLILRQDADASISDSISIWSLDYVYLENHSANDVNLTVFFTR